jgi:hypothetical protein
MAGIGRYTPRAQIAGKACNFLIFFSVTIIDFRNETVTINLYINAIAWFYTGILV